MRRTQVTKPLLNARGLTLAEIMIALAINSIIVLAVVTLVSNTMLSAKSSESRQELATDFGLLQNYFARTIPNAGGMSIPTDAAFWVEDGNDCKPKTPNTVFKNCKESDRLTIASSDEGPTCTVVAFNAASGAATFNTVINAGVPTCCMSVRPLLHNQVLFVNGYDYRQLWVGNADIPSCSATLIKGPMAKNDNVDDTYAWAGGLVIPLQLDTFYLDADASTFNRYIYAKAGANANDGTVKVLADRVLDFQVSLGFDFNPGDGVVIDDTTASDEWAYNTSGETLTSGVFAKPERKNTLRMIAVGWVIGAPGAGNTGAVSTSVLNGPVRTKTGYVLQSGVAKLGARSVYVFD